MASIKTKQREKSRKRQRQIPIRVTDEQFQKIKENMKSWGGKNFQNFALMRLIPGYEIHNIKRDQRELDSFIFQLNKIGVNLNQLAKRNNSVPIPYLTTNNEKLLEEISQLIIEILNRLKGEKSIKLK
jgi:hypothetical protein